MQTIKGYVLLIMMVAAFCIVTAVQASVWFAVYRILSEVVGPEILLIAIPITMIYVAGKVGNKLFPDSDRTDYLGPKNMLIGSGAIAAGIVMMYL